MSLSTQKIFVAVAGNIGTGKTTLTRMLASHFGWEAHFESVTDNPYLADFYEDMKRWSFPLQIYFMTHRVGSHRAITLGDASAIQDRTIYEDAHIFARNLFESGQMESRDYENYLKTYQIVTETLTPPDLMIYLKKSLPRLKQQIQKRGRDYEQTIPDEYLSSLNRYYDEWIDGYSIGKKLVIESDHLDFVSNPQHFEGICKKVMDTIPQQDLFMTPKVDRLPFANA